MNPFRIIFVLIPFILIGLTACNNDSPSPTIPPPATEEGMVPAASPTLQGMSWGGLVNRKING